MPSRNSLPRQPFIGLALAASVGILAADFFPDFSKTTLVAASLLAATALISRKSLALYAFVTVGFFILHSLRTDVLPYAQLIADLGEEPHPVTVQGIVVSEPKIASSGTGSFFLAAESIEIDGTKRNCHMKLLARWRGPAELGDEVRLFGTAEPIGLPRNPGEFNRRAFLGRQGIQRSLVVRYPENGITLNHGNGNRITRAAQKSRDWMQATLSRGLENSPDVTSAINGMILGLRHQTEEDIEEPFQQTGTLHLFAVAGLHVGIVARLLWIVLTVARLPQRLIVALIIPALFFYSTITGLHISSVRAAVMTSALLAGFFAERRMFPINNLSAAATLVLCWNTNELFSVGFQLSFSVVTAIALLANPTYRLLQHGFAADPFLPRTLFGKRQQVALSVTTWLARALSVSFAAWIGSLPSMVAYYFLITPVSLVANLVVVPIAFFVLAGGLVSLAIAPISTWLSTIFNNTNWLLTKAILGSVYLFAQLPGGHAYLAHPQWTTKPSVEINVLDLKSGAAAHIRTPTSDWLLDTGSGRDYQRGVRPYLRSRGIDRLDGLILTHGDSGHIGGAHNLLIDFHPGNLIDSAAPDRSPIHRRLMAELARNHQAHRLCVARDELDLSKDIRAKVVFPPRGIQAGRADDQTLVIQFSIFDRYRVLFMSDSGLATEQFLSRHYPNLQSDLLLKGQHYSGVSCSEEFLNAIQPQVIVASSCDFPAFERITDEWVDMVRNRGIKLFRQDKTGAVQLRFFADHWEAKAYVNSETFRSTK